MATRANLRTRARTKADQPGGFPTDAEYNDFLDEAGREVWYDLIQAGWPARPSTTSFTTTGGQWTTLSVSDVAFVTGVFRQDGGSYYEVPRIREGDRGSLYSHPSGPAQGYGVNVTSAGTSIEVLPAVAGYTYLVYYIPIFDGFAADATVWQGPPRSDELIVTLAAIKGLRKEGDDQGARDLERDYVRVLEKVTNMASWLDMRNPPAIRDTGDCLYPSRLPFDYDI